MSFSEPYNRFIASMTIDYDKWHDGIGYDLSALDELSQEEKASLAKVLRGRNDWRDAEALAAIELDAAMDAHDSPATCDGIIAMTRSTEPDTRLHAIQALHDAGKWTDQALETALLEELKTAKPFGGMVRCFLLIDRVPTERIKRRLLWCALNVLKEAPNFAGKLWQLCGKSTEEFDWSMRPLFLKFGADVNGWEKYKAVKEFCELVGMKTDDAA